MLFGSHAASSLRLEAGIPAWGTDLTREFTAEETGLVDGKSAQRLVHISIAGTGDQDALGREPIRVKGGGMVGKTTSGGRGHNTGKSLAFGYLNADAGADLEVKLLGEWYDIESCELVSI